MSVSSDEEKIKEAILSLGVMTQEGLDEAVQKALESNMSLKDCLYHDNILDNETMNRVSQKAYGIPFIILSEININPQIARILPERIVKSRVVLPFAKKDNELYVAVLDPKGLPDIDNLEMLTGYKVVSYLTTKTELKLAINEHFDIKHSMKQALIDIRMDKYSSPHKEDSAGAGSGIEFLRRQVDDVLHEESLDDEPIVRLVNSIINGGISSRASDIHLEPQIPEMKVRFRIDGVLHDIVCIPKHIQDSVVSRIKILANMDITKKRHPQDGHIAITIDGKNYYLRVSSLLTVNGEKIVLRIHDKKSILIGLTELGLTEEDFCKFQSLLARPYGMILVTGPTGSGKTTTLYAALNSINERTKNIITIEDPVEYQIPGINQVQVNPYDDITFETGLSYILRQDPNVIMVGEIRDTAPAESAIQASLTGHMVFSTLHTNNAPGSITRLLDMGIQSFQITSSLIGVIAQRLVRKVCNMCSVYYDPSPEELEILNLPPIQGEKFVYGKGCKFCYGSGHLGRTGVFEVMLMNDDIRRAIMSDATSQEIKRIAISNGMKTLQVNAAALVRGQIASAKEVADVIDFSE